MALVNLARIILVGCSLTSLANGALAQQPDRPLRVIAANAVKEGLQLLAAQYQQQSGQRFEIVWGGTESTERRVAAGERFDAVLIGSDAIDRLVSAGHLTAEGKVGVARTGVAVAVRAGYARPTVDAADGVRAAVLAAPRVAYSAGPSGVYVHTLLSRLGVGEQVVSKLTRPSSGAEVARLVARGEVDLAFAQVSEFLGVAGLQNLGPLPESLQNYTTYTAATPREGGHPQTASFLRFITSTAAKTAIEAMGMEQLRER